MARRFRIKQGGFYFTFDADSVSIPIDAYLYRDTAYIPLVCRVGPFGAGFSGEVITCQIATAPLAATLEDMAARSQRRLAAAVGDSRDALQNAIGIRGPGRMVKAGVVRYRVDAWHTGRWWWRKRHLRMRRTKSYALSVYDLEWRVWQDLPDDAPMLQAATLIVEDYQARQRPSGGAAGRTGALR